MKKVPLAFATVALTLGLGACGPSPSSPAPREATVTVTEHAEPSSMQYSSETEDTSAGYDILQEAWDAQDQDAKDGNCYLYEEDAESLIDLYMEFVNTSDNGYDDYVTRADVESFFINNC